MSYIEDYNYLVQQLSAEYARRYNNIMERDDIAQEMWVWFVGHPNKYKEWKELEQKDCDKLLLSHYAMPLSSSANERRLSVQAMIHLTYTTMMYQ